MLLHVSIASAPWYEAGYATRDDDGATSRFCSEGESSSKALAGQVTYLLFDSQLSNMCLGATNLLSTLSPVQLAA